MPAAGREEEAPRRVGESIRRQRHKVMMRPAHFAPVRDGSKGFDPVQKDAWADFMCVELVSTRKEEVCGPMHAGKMEGLC